MTPNLLLLLLLLLAPCDPALFCASAHDLKSPHQPPEVSDTAARPVPLAILRAMIAAFGVGLMAWLSTAIVFVDETEIVLLERLGTVAAVLDRPDDRGLNVKLPWPLGTARRFDRRTQLFDPLGREVFTRDRKNVTVDAYVCWKIAKSRPDAELLDRPAMRFFRSLGTNETAQARLETRVRPQPPGIQPI